MSSEKKNERKVWWGSRDAPDKIRLPENPPVFESRDAPRKTRIKPSGDNQSDSTATDQ